MNTIRPIIAYAYGLQYVGVGALVFYGLTVLVAQTFRFVRDGVWFPFSVGTMLSHMELGIPADIWGPKPDTGLGCFLWYRYYLGRHVEVA